jgi:hypothetical protein
MDLLTSGVGTRSTSKLRLPGEFGLDPETRPSTSGIEPIATATVELANESGQPATKKRRLTSLSAPSKDVILNMCQRVSHGMRAEEETLRAKIAARSVRPQSTTSTYASHAKKYVVFRTGQMSREEGNVDMFLEGLPVDERTKEWVQYIYFLASAGIFGRALASHLSGTKAFFRENSEVDMGFCCDNLKDVKEAKTRANSVDREVLRKSSLNRDARVKLPVFQELTDTVYDMAFGDLEDWSWHSTHLKGAATAQLLQTILGVRVSNSVQCGLTDHHLNTEDVIIKFERSPGLGCGQVVTWVLTGGDAWNYAFHPRDVHSLEIREHTGKGKVESKNRHINRVDSLSDRVCVIMAYWAMKSGAQKGEPFFTMHRQSPITSKFTVCRINSTHVNLVIKDASTALSLGPDHYSSHSARSGFVTKHSWAAKQSEAKEGNGAGAGGSELAQMGGWKSGANKGAMRMHYDRTISVYRSIETKYELSRADVVSMLSLVEQQKLPQLNQAECQVLRSFRRTVWGTVSVSRRRENEDEPEK